MEEKKKQAIEYETFSVKVPKKLVPFVQFAATCDKVALEDELASSLLDKIRADMEALNGVDLIEGLELGPIFYELLGDERFKPKEET